MSLKKERFIKGVILAPDSIALDGLEGEIKVDSATGKIQTTLKDGANPSAAREILTSSQTQTLTNKTLDVDNNTVSNIETDNLKAGVLNTNTSLTGASNTQVPSALAAKTYIDTANTAQQNIIDDLVTLSGVASGAENLGTFTGITIPDNSTNKQALQALETELETKAESSDLTTHTGASSDVHGVGVGNSVVGTGTSQALTNKTIDADLNTISNIEDTDIKVGAAISRAKLASGTANRVVVNNGTGVQTDAAAITAARALISDANGIPTHSSVTSTTLEFLDATSSVQTQLNSKVNASGGTLTNGSVITPARSDVKQDTKANLITYATTASNGQVVFATDTKEYLAVKDGLLVSMGGTGGVANINALLTQTFDTASTADFTQTGLELVTANMINGTQSARLIHQAASSRSFKQVVAVDRKYRSEPMQLSLQVRSSASNGNLTLLVTDETNSATIAASQSISTGYQTIASLVTNATTTVSGFSNSVINGLSVGMTVTGSGIATGTLISAINTTALTITLSQAATASATVSLNFSALPDRRTFSFIIPANCASMSYTITALQEANAPESYIDDVVIELASTALLSTSVDVPNVTAWNGYTPTFQGFGTPTNVEFEWRQVGENAEIRGKFASGTPTAVEARVGLPAGLTSAGTGLIPSIQAIGAYFIGVSTANDGGSVLVSPSTNYINISSPAVFNSGTVNALSPALGSSVGTGDVVSFFASIPCAGLSVTSTKTIALTQSGLVQSADSMVKLSGANGYGSTATTTKRFLTLNSSRGSDILYVDNSVSGAQFIAQTAGIYHATASENSTANVRETQLRILINGNFGSYDGQTYNTASADNKFMGTSWSGYLNVGDIVTVAVAVAASNNGADLQFTMSKQGSLKQVSVNPNSKITIPTSELRFEGASTRGSTATAIVKFDTLAKIRGDAFTVTNTAADGTAITMLKAGKLDISASLYFGAAIVFSISRNQAVLTAISTLPESLASDGTQGSNEVGSATWSGAVAVGDVIRVSAGGAPTNAGTYNSLNLSFQEQDIQVSVSNTLPQFSDSDSSVRVDTANGYGSTGTKIRRFSNVRDNIGVDVEYVDSAANGASFTVKSAGLYNIGYNENFSAVGYLGVSKNASSLSTNIEALAVSERLTVSYVETSGGLAAVAGEFYLQQGDVIRAHTSGGAASSNALINFTMSKVGKPNVTGVNVTPFVNVPQPIDQLISLTGGSATNADIVNFVVAKNTNNGVLSYDSTTGRVTVLKKAKINIESLMTKSTAGAGDFYPQIKKNGTAIRLNSASLPSAGYTLNNIFNDIGDVGDYYTIGISTQAASNVAATFLATALSDQILTAPETFSTDTASLQYASSSQYTLSTLSSAPVGTYITFTYAANTNTRTQTTTRPTQTDADMNANGLLVYTRAYNAASTAAQPAAIAIQIGKGLKGKSLDLYKSAGKTTSGSMDFYNQSSTISLGIQHKEYNESTGILFLDAGFNNITTITTSTLYYSDLSNQNSGYLVINASKNSSLTGMNIERVSARAVQSSGQSIPNTGINLITWDSIKTFDTHGGLNTSTGVYTAPETGYYSVNAMVAFNTAVYAVGNYLRANIYKNGSIITLGTVNVADSTTNTGRGCFVFDIIYLAKGDYIDIRVENNRTAGATTLSTNSGQNFLAIAKTNIGGRN